MNRGERRRRQAPAGSHGEEGGEGSKKEKKSQRVTAERLTGKQRSKLGYISRPLPLWAELIPKSRPLRRREERMKQKGEETRKEIRRIKKSWRGGEK